jgi:chromosome segregation ATPase
MTDYQDSDLDRLGALASLIVDAKACKQRIDDLRGAAAEVRNAESDRAAQLKALQDETRKAQGLLDEATRTDQEAKGKLKSLEAREAALAERTEEIAKANAALGQRESEVQGRENKVGERENTADQREREVVAQAAMAEHRFKEAQDLMANYDADKHAAAKALAGDQAPTPPVPPVRPGDWRGR